MENSILNLKEKKKKRRGRKIFNEKLENIGTEIFEDKRYKNIVKNEMGNKHGIYALYDKKGNVYYVGRAENLRRRLKQHLKDKHNKKWYRFTIYFTKKKLYMEIMEEVLISIVNPDGNRQRPRKIKNKMKFRMIKAMEKMDSYKRKKIMGKLKPKSKMKKAS